MKFLALFCLIAVAAAMPERDARTTLDERDVQGDGGYNFAFETDNGIRRSEKGTPGAEGAITQTGEIRFTFPDGQEYVMTFVADENGFQPTSPFLPVGPVKK